MPNTNHYMQHRSGTVKAQSLKRNKDIRQVSLYTYVLKKYKDINHICEIYLL